MNKIYLITVCLVTWFNSLAQDFGTLKFTWMTNGLENVKEYRVYSTFGSVTNKFELLAVTTNNFVVVSNQIHIRRIMFATTVDKNGKESMSSRMVSFPRENSESPKCFDYHWIFVSDSAIPYKESHISRSTPNSR